MDVAEQNRSRAARFGRILRRYDTDSEPRNRLADLLADAMHWCRANDSDFHRSLGRASNNFLAEVMDELETAERVGR